MKCIRPGRAIFLFGLMLLSMTPKAFASDPETSPAPASLDSLARATPTQIKAFFNSGDYQSRHRSNAEFITDLYRGILRREPDSAGFDAWLAALSYDFWSSPGIGVGSQRPPAQFKVTRWAPRLRVTVPPPSLPVTVMRLLNT